MAGAADGFVHPSCGTAQVRAVSLDYPLRQKSDHRLQKTREAGKVLTRLLSFGDGEDRNRLARVSLSHRQ